MLFLFGCTQNDYTLYNANAKIVTIEKMEQYCRYEVESVEANGYVRYTYFFDNCGKFNVGDTIQITKK